MSAATTDTKTYKPWGRSVVTETSATAIRRRNAHKSAQSRQRSLSSSPRIVTRKLGQAPISPLSPELQRSRSRRPQTVWYSLEAEDDDFEAPARTPSLSPSVSPKFQHLMLRRNSHSPTLLKTKLHHFSPQEVARELCLMDSELLRKIRPQELQGGSWMKEQKSELAPNVLAMVKASNQIAQLVPSEVLAEITPQARAKVITIFIKIASKCHNLQNFNSLKAVLAGLQCTPVFRLKRSWKEVPAKKKKKYAALSKLMSEDHNWNEYRREIQSKLDDNVPCIPFLGVLLTSIVQQGSAKLHGRRYSGVEDYTVMEAITVRNRLEKMRKISGKKRYTTFNEDSGGRPSRKSVAEESGRLARQSCVDFPEPHHSILEEEEEGGSFDSTTYTDFPQSLLTEDASGPTDDTLNPSTAPETKLKHWQTISEIGCELVESCVNRGNRCSQEQPAAANGSLDLSCDSNKGVASSRGGMSSQSHVSAADDGHSNLLGEHGEREDAKDKFRCRNGLTSYVPGSAFKGSFSAERPRGASLDTGSQPKGKKAYFGTRNTQSLDIASLSHIPSVTVDCSEDLNPMTSQATNSDSLDGSISGSMATTTLNMGDHGQFQRSISDQAVWLGPGPPTLGSFLSMECLADLLENPHAVLELVRSESAQGFYKNSSLSLSSDEGLGHSDVDTTSPDLASPLLASPAHYSGDSSGVEDRKSSGDSNICVGGMERNTDRATIGTELDSNSKLIPYQLPSQDRYIGQRSTRKSSSESIAAEEPVRRRSRRRASKVLQFALARSDKTMHVPSLLERYQVCSLACCMSLCPSKFVRELILNAPCNTEGQNYKLSYEREPQ